MRPELERESCRDKDYPEHWRGLDGQVLRYTLIAALLKDCDSVLDLGCGAGHLSGYLPGVNYQGIDCDGNAIGEAVRTQAGDFVCADLAKWRPDGSFDAIVFNESLYYMPDTWLILTRYASSLSPRGIFVLSIWRELKWWRTQNLLTKWIALRFFKFHEMDVRRIALRDGGLTWDIVVGKANA